MNEQFTLAGFRAIFYDGDSGSIYKTVDLASQPDEMSKSNGFVFQSYNLYDEDNPIQNGPDGVALVAANNQVLEFWSYGGTFLARQGPASGKTTLDMGVFELSSGSSDSSLSKKGQGYRANDFRWAPPDDATPGEMNKNQDIVCPVLNPHGTAYSQGGFIQTYPDKASPGIYQPTHPSFPTSYSLPTYPTQASATSSGSTLVGPTYQFTTKSLLSMTMCAILGPTYCDPEMLENSAVDIVEDTLEDPFLEKSVNEVKEKTIVDGGD